MLELSGRAVASLGDGGWSQLYPGSVELGLLTCITCRSKTQLCKVLAYVAALAETNWGDLMEAAEQDKRQGAPARAPSLSLVFTVQNLFYS